MPLVRNTTKNYHVISDLDMAFTAKGDQLGTDVRHLTDKQIANSMGVQLLVATGELEILTEEDVKTEAIRRAKLKKELEASREAAPVIEDAGEVVRSDNWDAKLSQNDPDEFSGGIALPSDRAVDRGEAPVVPFENLNSVQADPAEALGDLVPE